MNSVNELRNRQLLSTAGLIACYLISNLALTFYSKQLLSSFHRPYLLTALHTGISAIGCKILAVVNHRRNQKAAKGYQPLSTEDRASTESDFVPSRLEDAAEKINATHLSQDKYDLGADHVDTKTPGWRDWFALQAFAFLYAFNIAVSNASLGLVSIPFHQVIRSTCPLFTILLSRLILNRNSSWRKHLPLAPVVGGAILACFGDLSFTCLGFALTILGTLLAAFKTVITNFLQGGAQRANPPTSQQSNDSVEKGLTPAQDRSFAFTKYTSMELLGAVSPSAAVYCLIMSFLNGEFSLLTSEQVSSALASQDKVTLALVFLGNGLLAFLLNVVSFKTNKAAGAVAMTVLGNVKQVLTVSLALILTPVQASPLNLAGIALTLAGSALYGTIAVKERNK